MARGMLLHCNLGHVSLYGMRIPGAPICVINGSFFTTPNDPRDVLLQALTAGMLVNGTRTRDAVELASELEGRGASLTIQSEGRRVSFSLKVCAEDLEVAAEILADCLGQPCLDASAMPIERERLMAEMRYQALFPAAAAEDVLRCRLYHSDDIRYREELDERIRMLEQFDVDDVRGCYDRLFHPDQLMIAPVGEFDPERLGALFYSGSKGARSRTAQPIRTEVQPILKASSARVQVPGDRFAAVFGQRVELCGSHPDFPTMWLANNLFGGTFNSRLVRTIRDERGLTYRVRSVLDRPDPLYSGCWRVELSLSPEMLGAGVEAVRGEIDRFVTDGVDREELEAGKRQAIGAFQVNLSSLLGTSESILIGAESGHGRDYLNTFVERISAITHEEVNRVIREHLSPDGLCQVIAGPTD